MTEETKKSQGNICESVHQEITNIFEERLQFLKDKTSNSMTYRTLCTSLANCVGMLIYYFDIEKADCLAYLKKLINISLDHNDSMKNPTNVH